MNAALVAITTALLRMALPKTGALADRAQSAAADLELALAVESEPSSRDRDRRLAWVWSYYESSWRTDPEGSNDQGAACGVMQVHASELVGVLPAEWTCRKLRTDRVLGYRAGLRTLHHLETKCGSLEAALGAFSGNGTCARGFGLVHRRARIAGVLLDRQP